MVSKNKIYEILVVCRANITRSVYISGYMNMLLNEHILKKNINISSAGIEARNGSSPNQVIRHVAQLNGFNVNEHKSKKLTLEIANYVDVILTMEDWQNDFINENFSVEKNKVIKITNYLSKKRKKRGNDILDPTGKDTIFYREFFEIAHSESKRIISCLK